MMTEPLERLLVWAMIVGAAVIIVAMLVIT
jgi:hypothetical protein